MVLQTVFQKVWCIKVTIKVCHILWFIFLFMGHLYITYAKRERGGGWNFTILHKGAYDWWRESI